MTHYDAVIDSIIYQTDTRLSPAMNRFGCRVMVLLAIPQFVAGRALPIETVKAIVDAGRKVPRVIITDEMECGKDEDWLINEAFRALKVQRRGRQVAWNPQMIESRSWQYQVAHWETDGPDGHYSLFDRIPSEVYDPHNAEQAGRAINKRGIIRRLGYSTWAV